MSTLVLWRSPTAEGAERASRSLADLAGRERGLVHDVALVSWPRGRGKLITRPLPELASDQALGEGFWRVLFGLVFYSPLLGAAVVSGDATSSGSFAEVGIDDTFVNRVRDTITPGTSGLFVLGADALVEQLRDLPGAGPPVRLLVTRLSPRQESTLREVFVG